MRRMVMVNSLMFENLMNGGHDVIVDLTEIEIAPWCAELGLLAEGLVEDLVLKSKQGGRAVRLNLNRSLEFSIIRELGHELLEVTLSANEFGHLFVFSLEFFRDQGANVTHIHLQPVSNERQENDLTFYFY